MVLAPMRREGLWLDQFQGVETNTETLVSMLVSFLTCKCLLPPQKE